MSDYEWKKLTDKVECQKSWSTRNCMEDPVLHKFAKTCKFFDLGDGIDVQISTVDGHTYLVVDWEEDDSIEETEKTIAYRIKINQN